MNKNEVSSELMERLRSDLDYFNGNLPRDYAIAWRAYFAALLEWGILSVQDHNILGSLLPQITDDPVEMILLGRESD